MRFLHAPPRQPCSQRLARAAEVQALRVQVCVSISWAACEAAQKHLEPTAEKPWGGWRWSGSAFYSSDFLQRQVVYLWDVTQPAD